MDLFADVDIDATADNVNDLLKNKLPRLALRCGEGLTDLSSPALSIAPAHTGKTDGQENMIVNSFSIAKVVDAIHQTIFHCSTTSKFILIDNYLKHVPQEQIIMNLPYERSYYFKALKPIALNEFADRYDYWQHKCHVDPEDIRDLHVYCQQEA